MRRAIPRSLLLLILGALTIGLVWAGARRRSQRTVVIASFMQHQALDAVVASAAAALAHDGFDTTRDVRIIHRNANGSLDLVRTIAQEIAATHPDLVIAVATPMAQAIAKLQVPVPLVFAAVTDPVGAELLPNMTQPAALITGTSDAFPYRAQLQLIREITPKVRRIGVVYNPGEAPAAYGIRELRRYAPENGMTIVEAAALSTNEVQPAAENLVRGQKVDALLITSDNTSIAGLAGALKVAQQYHLPLYAGDAGSVAQGALATVSVGYDSLGRATGHLAARMLRGERNIPAVVASGTDVHVNTTAAAAMGVTIPPEVLARATVHHTP